jgi:DNA polymerase-1
VADLDDVQLHYVESSEEAAQFVEWLKRPRNCVAIDTETTGLEQDARIRLVQFGDETDAWTLRWDRWKGAAIEGLELMKRARQRVVLHNSPYDVPKIEAQSADGGDGFKFDWGLLEDTMLMSRLSNPVGSHSLKHLAAKHVDPRSRGMQNVLSDAMSKNGWNWETVPYDYEGYTVYAGIDCILTARLLPVLEAREFDRDLYRTEITVAEACTYMSETGMLVDREYCEQQIVLLQREIEDIVQQGKDRHRFHAYGSNQLVAERLFSYGATWDERTDAGRVAVDSDVLERVSVQAESPAARDLARLVLAHRTRVRLLGTYFKNMLEGSDRDGRVHPDINTLEAVTGRMTVRGQPAMQTLPRGPRVRRGFLAGPGRYLLLADYAQIEQRKLASFCMDPGLIAAIATGDLHTAVAEMIFGGHISASQRQLAKSSGYAIIYGAGPEKFAHTAGVSAEAGADFLNRYHEMFPGVKPFIQSVQAKSRERERNGLGAHVVTPAGRRLHMRKIDSHYTLVNYLIQGSAADTFKQAIARMWETDLGPLLRLPVHDECIFEVPDDLDPTEVQREIVRLMEDHTMTVPMEVEATGPFQSWADKYGEGE